MKNLLFLSVLIAMCSFTKTKVHPKSLPGHRNHITAAVGINPVGGEKVLNWLPDNPSTSSGNREGLTKKQMKFINKMTLDGQLCYYIYDPGTKYLCRRMVIYDCVTKVIYSDTEIP